MKFIFFTLSEVVVLDKRNPSEPATQGGIEPGEKPYMWFPYLKIVGQCSPNILQAVP